MIGTGAVWVGRAGPPVLTGGPAVRPRLKRKA